jgi:hypothetical protein
MIFQKCVIVLSAAAILAGSVNQSKALPVTPPPAPIVAGSSSAAAGVAVVGGFIGVIAALCIYDIVLKINGVKNWDGTPKVTRRLRR